MGGGFLVSKRLYLVLYARRAEGGLMYQRRSLPSGVWMIRLAT
jgi:hypothetical protein